MGAEKHPEDETRIQSQGRKDNAAQHVNAAEPNAGAERYPSTNKDDSVEAPVADGQATGESRSFEGSVESADAEPRTPEPDPSVNQGRVGPAGDAGEGKR